MIKGLWLLLESSSCRAGPGDYQTQWNPSFLNNNTVILHHLIPSPLQLCSAARHCYRNTPQRAHRAEFTRRLGSWCDGSNNPAQGAATPRSCEVPNGDAAPTEDSSRSVPVDSGNSSIMGDFLSSPPHARSFGFTHARNPA